MPDPGSCGDGAEPTEPWRKSIGKLRATYEAADNFARKVGEFSADVAIPAHNELRYAGHHLLRALADDGSISDPVQLDRAVAHCERAQYEAAEAGISYAIDIIEQFKKDYRTVPITSVIKDYMEIKKIARDAQELLTRTRSTAGPDEHGELPDPRACISMFEKLRESCGKLEDAREDLNKLIRDEKTSSRRFLIGLAVATTGVIVSISALSFLVFFR